MNKQFKRLIIIINLVILSFFLNSCTNSRELDTLGIVITSGLDYEDGKIVITNEIVNPISGTSSAGTLTEEKSVFVKGTGDTIEEALAETTLHFNRVLYYPHNHLVIFGEEFAKRGITEYMDMLSRDREQRELAYMLVAKGAKASDVMGINGGVSNSPGIYLFEIIDKEIFDARTRTLTIDDFLKYFYRSKEGSVLGVVEGIERAVVDKSRSEDVIHAVNISGGAVFKDGKLIEYFSGEEMVGFNFIVDEIKTTSIIFEAPGYLISGSEVMATRGTHSAVRVFKSKTKGDIKVVDGNIHLFFDVSFRGILKENTQGLDISKPGVLEEMEKACAMKVEEYIKTSMDKAQELNLDVFGIGTLTHQVQPKLWKEIKDDWANVFSTIDYTVNVEADINAAGFTNTPPNIMKGR